jgi:hypothetical protein
VGKDRFYRVYREKNLPRLGFLQERDRVLGRVSVEYCVYDAESGRIENGAQRGFEPLTHALRIRSSLRGLISINKLQTPNTIYTRQGR